jgi:hypothetical protein
MGTPATALPISSKARIRDVHHFIIALLRMYVISRMLSRSST